MNFLEKLAAAKLAQATNQANPNLREFENTEIIFDRVVITKDIEIDKIKLDKATFFLVDCLENPQGVTALDGFQMATVCNAELIAKTLGTTEAPDYGPWPIPLRGLIKSRQTEDRIAEGKAPINYVEIVGAAVEYAKAQPEESKDQEG